jgi:hypothetical protein
LFAQDTMFAYPGLFLVLAYTAFKSRRTRDLVVVALAAAAALAIVVSSYVFIWSRIEHTKEEAYWGKKYDVFYSPEKARDDKFEWLAKHYASVAAMPGSRRSLWASERYRSARIAELRSLDALVWILLHIAGLTFVMRTRRFREVLLLVLPLDVTVVFNALGFWPLGDFRTNLFTLGYTAAIAAFAVERRATRMSWADFVPAGCLVFAPLLVFERDWHARKTVDAMTTDHPGAMKTLIRLQKPGFSGQREKLVLDQNTCDPWRYYTTYHPTYSHKLADALARRFDVTCKKGGFRPVLAEVRASLTTSPRTWLVASPGPTMRGIDRSWPHDLEQIALARIGEDDHVVVGITAKATPATEPAVEPETDTEGSER